MGAFARGYQPTPTLQVHSSAGLREEHDRATSYGPLQLRRSLPGYVGEIMRMGTSAKFNAKFSAKFRAKFKAWPA
jgi:hypothetical protein